MELSTNVLITCMISLYLIIPVSSQFHFFTEFCVDKYGNYTLDSTYHSNLNSMLSNLTIQAELSLFNNSTVGQQTDQTYGLFMCRGDLSVTQCHHCVKNASKTILEKCSAEKEAIVWYNECMVRYANRNIFSRHENEPFAYSWIARRYKDPEQFGEKYSKTVNGLIKQAAYNTSSHGYAFGQANLTLFESVYVLAQCTPDILGSQCEKCLRVALRMMAGCCGTSRMSLAMYLPSCWLRYDQAPIVGGFGVSPSSVTPSPSFGSPPELNSSSSLPPPSSPGSSTAATMTSGGITFIFAILMAVTGISLSTAW